MKLALVISAVLLTGCAKPPEWLAEMADRNDPCQRVELVKTGQYPQWCGGGKKTAIYNTSNQRVGYIKQ